MAFKKKLWGYAFHAGKGPDYPCPHCKVGSLKLRKSTVKRAGPVQARTVRLSDAAFTGMLECHSCEGSAVVVGYVRKDGYLVPRGIYPAPPIITYPSATPREVANELNTAFALFWVDMSSCANKIRVSLERLLEFLNVPAGRLASRIQSLEGADKLQTEVFHALREVGNVGSHGSDARRDVVLAAFEIYEDQLRKLFTPQGTRIESLAKRLRETKGR